LPLFEIEGGAVNEHLFDLFPALVIPAFAGCNDLITIRAVSFSMAAMHPAHSLR
jgi:hypothetical protein